MGVRYTTTNKNAEQTKSNQNKSNIKQNAKRLLQIIRGGQECKQG